MTRAVFTVRVNGSAPITGISVRARPAVTRSLPSGSPRNMTPTTYTPVWLLMCHSCQGTVRVNCTDALGASGASKAWKVGELRLARPTQLFRWSIGLSCSVEISARSAAVDSRLLSIQAIACGLPNVVELVFVTVPLITTCWPGFGATGPNVSMVTWTVGSSAGAATVGVVPRIAADAAISRPAPAAAESLSRRLNTPSP